MIKNVGRVAKGETDVAFRCWTRKGSLFTFPANKAGMSGALGVLIFTSDSIAG